MLIGIVVAALLGVLILLMQKIKGLYYIGAGLIMTSVLLFVPAVIIKLQYEFLISKFNSIGEITENPFYEDILKLFRQYTNALTGEFVLRGGICLLLGILVIVISYFLAGRMKQEK